MTKTPPKLIAFHLPQFHEIPENNTWWGKGFTEWTKVREAKPLFDGHDQPRAPIDNNYYDLSNHQTLIDQATLAAKHGLDGFCFYHYWFNGKRLLERPLENLLANSKPDFPFMLAWANEPWTRAWNEGGEREVLMPQLYGTLPNWKEHFNCLVRFFRDPRYIKIDGMPVLLIYRPESIPNLSQMLETWDSLMKKSGMPGIHLVRMLTCYSDLNQSFAQFQGSVEFEPGFSIAKTLPLRKRIRRKFNRLGMKFTKDQWPSLCKYFLQRFDYEEIANHVVERKLALSPLVYPGVFVDWDNTPRRSKNGLIFSKSTPSAFGRFLQRQMHRAQKSGSPFVFINAWNEWAEGAHLEPSEKYKYQYLETIRNAFDHG